MNSTDTCQIRINNGTKISYLEKDTDNVLTLGHFDEGDELRITFYISEDDSITFDTSEPYLWYFDTEAYESTMARMEVAPQFIIDDGSTDDNIFGSIKTAKSEQMILTSIPYDEGWNVYIDGEKVEIYKTMGALMAFDIADAGEHTLELEYMPKLYKPMLCISIASIIIFILICAIDLVLKKTLLKARRVETYDDIWVLEDNDYIVSKRLDEPKLEPLSKAADENSTDDQNDSTTTEE